MGQRSTSRKCRFWQKKNHIFKWCSLWSWRVCKQAKLSHSGHKKPARIHWKAGARKTRHNWAIFLRKRARETVTVNSDRYRTMLNEFLFTFGFNRTAVLATQPKLHSMFFARFLKIALSAANLISFGRFGAAIWHRWIKFCGVPSKISVTPASQRQLTL